MASLQDRLPPSTAAVVLATAIITGLGGYFLGQARSLGIFSSSKKGESWPNSYDVNVQYDSSDEELMKSLKGGKEDDSEEEQGALSSFEGNKEECKLVLVVRTDLGMSKGALLHELLEVQSRTYNSTGKIAAQCSHATLACYKYFLSHAPKSPILKRWEQLGQAKVALQVNNEEQMEMLQAQAVSLGLCAQVIHDAGRTQIASGSATVCGIGPGPKSVIDQVTGHLKLL